MKNNRHSAHSWRDRFTKRFSRKIAYPPDPFTSEEVENNSNNVLVPRQSNRGTALSQTDAPPGKDAMTEHEVSSGDNGFHSEPVEDLEPKRVVKPPITPEEDRVLIEWVDSKPFDGYNPVYWGKDFWIPFEKAHPQRSWRSWSARYRARHWDPNASSKDVRNGNVSHEKIVKKPFSTEEPPQKLRSSSAPRADVVRIKTRERHPYTEEDDRVLIKWVFESHKAGLHIWSIARWKQFAIENPRHSWTAWKSRYRYKFYDPPSETVNNTEETSESEVNEMEQIIETDNINDTTNISEAENIDTGNISETDNIDETKELEGQRNKSSSPVASQLHKTSRKSCYTAADDELVLRFLAGLEEKGFPLWKPDNWREFAADVSWPVNLNILFANLKIRICNIAYSVGVVGVEY